METQVQDSISLPAASRRQDRSPTKSPIKSQRQPLADGRQDDVGRDRTNDQRATAQPLQPASAMKPNKYLQLLNVAYPIKPNLPASTEPAATAAAVSPLPASRQPTSTAKPTATIRSSLGNVTSLLRSSGSALQGLAAKAKPAVRVSRSKASILDPSAGGSKIPASPAAASDTELSPAGAASRATAASADGPSLARRSLPAAAAGRPQYAFGSRVDANSTRKPSPARRSVPGSQADRSRASPQRVPLAARSTSLSGSTRSASAPRAAGPDKVQSRFTMHQANAVAEQRSKTPNRAARGRTSAAAAASPTVLPANNMRSAAALGSAAERHIARLRASQEGLASKLPGFSATHSASPSTAAAARSVPAAGSAGSSTAGAGSAGASPVAKQLSAHGVQRTPVSTAERPTAAASLASSKTVVPAVMGMPTIQDRYKSGYKHTPAAAAVAEARAAAAATSPAVPAVPKLSLGALLSSPGSPVLLHTRNREQKPSGSPKERAQQRAIPRLGLAIAAQHDHDSRPAASPFLGRMSGFGELNGAMAQQQSPAFYTPPQQRPLLPLHVAAAVPAVSPANSVYYTPVHAEESMQTPAAAQPMTRIQTADASCTTPPLLHRSLSTASASGSAELPNEVSREMLSRYGSRQLEGQSSITAGLLSTETSALSMDSAVAVAAKGLVLPLHKLQEPPRDFSSPPKHRRGNCGSPKGAAAVCSELLKRKASDICNGLTAAADAAAAVAAEDTTAAAVAFETVVPVATPATKSPAKARKKTPASAGSNASWVPNLARRSVGSVIDSVERHAAKGHSAAVGFVTPKANTGLMNGVNGSTGKSTPGSSIGDKMRMMVPRLDLTPVLTQMNDSDLSTHEADAAAQQQPLALEYHELGERADVADVEREHGRKTRSGREGRPVSAGSGARRGPSSSSRGGARAGGSNRKSSTPDQQSAQKEAFYVYEAVMPTEETRTYDELRRALLKCPGGQKLAANLQGLWGCYQDARKATEAMAFRGHRLLDQVSNEYCSYKRHAEEQLQQLQHERDDLQLAVATGDGAGSLAVSDKDQQVKCLRQENDALRLQLAEMEKAMQQAADYHFSQQADQVHVKARTIAQSDTTNILFQKTMEQQQELQSCQQALEEMTAAMKLAAGALAATNYMDPNGPVRTVLPVDTLAVLDGLIHSTAAEGGMIDSLLQGTGATLPHVHIEELPC